MIPGRNAAEVATEMVPGVVDPVHEALLARPLDAVFEGALLALSAGGAFGGVGTVARARSVVAGL